MQQKTLNIHFKILTKPKSSLSVKKMIGAMRETYVPANIDVKLASRKVLNLNDPALAILNDLDVGPCNIDQPTEDQNDLAQFRDNIPDQEIVIFVCHSLSGGFAGCSVFTDGNKPMAAISRTNVALYTLAHEVGHLLGLPHTTSQAANQLMTPNGAATLDPIPVLSNSEINKMRNSPSLVNQ